MNRSSEASIADEVRALGWLAPINASTRVQMLEMLRGIRPKHSEERGISVPPAPPVPPAEPRPGPLTPRPTPLPEPPLEPPPVPPKPLPNPSAREQVRPAPGIPRATLSDVTTVTCLTSEVAPPARLLMPPAPAAASRADSLRQPVPASIVAPRYARAVLSLLAASRGESNVADLSALVERMAHGQPVERIPRLRTLTTRLGVQLLIDCGNAMAPLAADREQVRAGMVRLLGSERVETLYFAGCPTLRAGNGLRRSWQPGWKSPAPGTPVIVIGAVGLAGSPLDKDWAPVADWLDFAARARAGCNPVIVLSPFGPERWLPELSRSFVWVPWCESLSAAKLNRIRSDADAHCR